MSLSLLHVLAMDRQYEIRQRRVEISTGSPDRIPADAILLPWTVQPEGEAGVEFGAEAPACVSEVVLEEIADYRGEREVMLTSADELPARFLFHLSFPDELPVDEDLIEGTAHVTSILDDGGARTECVMKRDFDMKRLSGSDEAEVTVSDDSGSAADPPAPGATDGAVE